MKKFLVGAALLVLALSPLHLAFALPLEIAPPPGATGTNNAPVITPTVTSPARAEAAAQEAKANERKPGEKIPDYCRRTNSTTAGQTLCALENLGSLVSEAFQFWGLASMWWVLSMTAYIYFLFAEFLMWLGTTFFDNVLYLMVINMSVFIVSENAKGIVMGWEFIRDLMNIGIIAGFIIVGISTILQAQQYNANRFLARLIIAALLVNFSYFFAGAVIDASNYIATEIYTSKIVSADKEVCTHTMKQAKTLSYLFQYSVAALIPGDQLCSISKTFTETLSLGTWSELKATAVNNTEASQDSNMTVTFIGAIGGFFYVTVGFIFFSAATLLLGRFVVLILLLITSPVGIAGINIPYLDEYAKKWWSMLFSQAFFAPVFVMLMGIGLHIIHDINKVLKKGDFQSKESYGNIASGNFDDAIATIPMFITFFIGVAFMYAALQISRAMSESGKEYVGAIYDGLQKSIGSFYGNVYQATAGQALRIPSLAYDSTVGQLSRIPLLNMIPGVKQITQGVGLMLRPDQGGRPFGASQTNADAAKSMQEYSKSLEGFGFLKVLGKPDEALQKLSHALFIPLENAWESMTGKSVAALMAAAARGETLTPAQRRKIERYVEGLSDEEIGGMTSTQLAEIAPYMSAKQFKKTMDRADLNDNQRKEIMNSRWAEINAAKEAGDTERVATLIGNLDKTERKILFTERDDVRTDKQILAALNAKTFDEVSDDSTLWSGPGGAEQLKGIQDYRAAEVAKNPSRMSDSDAKRIQNKHVTSETINTMTPAQARRLYINTKDATLRARLAARFPDLAQPGPAAVAADEDAENERKRKEKEEEDKKQKEEEEAEEVEKKKKEDKKQT